MGRFLTYPCINNDFFLSAYTNKGAHDAWLCPSERGVAGRVQLEILYKIIIEICNWIIIYYLHDHFRLECSHSGLNGYQLLLSNQVMVHNGWYESHLISLRDTLNVKYHIHGHFDFNLVFVFLAQPIAQLSYSDHPLSVRPLTGHVL